MLFNSKTPPGYLDVEVYPPSGTAAAIGGLQPQWEGELSRNLFVFFLGFLMIFIGIFLAKKFKVIGDLFMSNEDRKLLEKAKRTLGLGSSSPNPNSGAEPAPYSSSNHDMHPFGNNDMHSIGTSDVHPASDNDMQFDNSNGEPSRRKPGEGYPTMKMKKNEPVSVGGPESAENLKDTLLGG